MAARPSIEESITLKHDRFVDCLLQLEPPWGFPDGIYPAPDPGSDLAAPFQLDKKLGEGLGGEVIYRYRRGLEDWSRHDDGVWIKFDPNKIDYANFVNCVLPKYITAFEPYRLYVRDEEFTHIDFDKSRGVNGRAQVIRIHPVNHFDDELCRRAFRLSAEKVVERSKPLCQRAEVLNGGAYLVVKDEPVSIEEAEVIHDKMWEVIFA